MVVCDVCGRSPAQTVGISAGDRNYRKDLCAEHLAELLKGSRAPTRGRPAGTSPASGQRRRGRPSRAAAAAKASAPATSTKRERRKITDPVILEKRRAALAKARQARAAKRAAAAAAPGS